MAQVLNHVTEGNKVSEKDKVFQYIVLSQVVDTSGTLLGYLLLRDGDAIGIIRMVSLKDVNLFGTVARYVNAEYDEQHGLLVGKDGNLLNKYPKITMDYKIVANNGMIIQRTITDKDTDNIIGAIVYTPLGVRYNMSISDLERMIQRKIPPINFKYERGIFTTLNGDEVPTIKMRDPRKHVVYNSKTGENVELVEDNTEELDELNEIEVAALDVVRGTEEFKKTESTMLLAKKELKRVSPYFYYMLNAVKQIPVNNGSTLGVTEDTMFFDVGFVNTITKSELVYILIHEMMHIAMHHSIRFGSRGNHDLWNVACDLYINTIIAETYIGLNREGESSGPVFGGSEVSYNGGVIKCPLSGIHIETMKGRTSLDIAKESPETIYKKLLEENPNGAKQLDDQGVPINPDAEKTTAKSTVKGTGMPSQGQQTMMQSQIMDMAKELEDALMDMIDQEAMLQEKADSNKEKGQELIKKAKEELDIQKAKSLTNKAKELKAETDKINEHYDDLDEDCMNLAEAIAKLSVGTIRRETAIKVADNLDKTGQSVADIGIDLINQDLKNDAVTILNARDKLNEMIKQVPDTVDMSQQQSGDGGMGGQPSGIVPNNAENVPEDMLDPNSQGQPSSNGKSQQDDNQQGNGQGDSQGQNQQGQGQGDNQGQSSSQGHNQASNQASSSGGGNQLQRGQQASDQDSNGGQSGEQSGSQSGQQGQGGGGAFGKKTAHIGGSSSGSGQDQQGQDQQGQGDTRMDPFAGTQELRDSIDMLNGEGKTVKAHRKKVEINFNGQKIQCDIDMDIMTNNKAKTKEAQKANRDASRSILQKAKSKIDIQIAKGNLNQDGSLNTAESMTHRQLTAGCNKLLDWKTLFRRKFKYDKKYMENKHRENIRAKMRGQQGIGRIQTRRQKVVKNVIVAIDVSGSVSDEEIGVYLGEVASLIKYMSNDSQTVYGELCYWSTKVGDAGEFFKLKDLNYVDFNYSTGGTDVNCFFNWLVGREESMTGAKNQIRVKDATMILVLTDGCFGSPLNNAYKTSEFNDKIVWVIDGNAESFAEEIGVGTTVDLKCNNL